MNNEIQFILERYRSGGANRYTCPKCNKRKCFTRYVDVRTGEYVADDCGKCNHESSCGYHYPPREYFHDHPQVSNDHAWKKSSINAKQPVFAKEQRPAFCLPTHEQQTEFFDIDWAEESARRKSTFRTWFESLPFDEALKQKVLAEYYVGGTSNDIIAGGLNYGPAAIFWMIDEQQRVHDAKLIAYTCDGHRVPNWGNSMRSICVKTKVGPQLSHTDKVLFGLHLLSRYPDKTVGIVESEKSALICACRFPQFLWLATGGCGNLNAEKIKPLMNRKVVVFPDSGEYEKWHESMKASGHRHFYVEQMLEEYLPNTDIADIILGVAKKK